MLDMFTMFVIASASISVIMSAMKKVVGKEVYTHNVFVRLQPLMPLVIGVIFAMLIFTDFTLSLRFAAGIMAGACSGHAYKIFKQSIKAEDVRVSDGPDN